MFEEKRKKKKRCLPLVAAQRSTVASLFLFLLHCWLYLATRMLMIIFLFFFLFFVELYSVKYIFFSVTVLWYFVVVDVIAADVFATIFISMKMYGMVGGRREQRVPIGCDLKTHISTFTFISYVYFTMNPYKTLPSPRHHQHRRSTYINSCMLFVFGRRIKFYFIFASLFFK